MYPVLSFASRFLHPHLWAAVTDDIGIQGNFDFVPDFLPDLTLSSGQSLLDANHDLYPISRVRSSDSLA
jgi:hypothetical protein